MKKAKKLLALVPALAMVLAMTACGAGQKSEAEPGSMNGGTYENSFIGIGCKLDEGWTYLSEEEMPAESEWVNDEKLAERLRSREHFYDMVAMSEDGLTNVNVAIENLGLIYGTVLDTGSYVDVALRTLEDDIAGTGLNITACEKVSLDFCGKSTYGISVAGTITVQDVEVEVFQLLACVKAGTYMCCVTASSYFEDSTADVLELFYSI